MLRIVTDGAADILPTWKTEYGIDVIPVNIMFGERSYLQGVELDKEGFYKLVDEKSASPRRRSPLLTSSSSSIAGSHKKVTRSSPFT